jgi:hypothetical protein
MEYRPLLIDAIKILGSALVGFLLAIWGTRIGRDIQNEQRCESIARLLASEVFQELKATVKVVDGIVGNIEANRLMIDAQRFEATYSPSTDITRFDDIGLLEPSVVDAYVSYRQIVRASSETRKSCLSALVSKDNNAPALYFAYLLGLNEVTQRGKSLLTAILEKHNFDKYRKMPAYAKPLTWTI